jgi:hypothetical protein
MPGHCRGGCRHRQNVRNAGRLILDAHDTESIYYIAMNWRQLRSALPRVTVVFMNDSVRGSIFTGVLREVSASMSGAQ